MARIELAPLTWKDRALPLCNIRIVHFYPLSHWGVVWTTPLADYPGFEPGTLELTALCSAVELVVNVSIYLYNEATIKCSPSGWGMIFFNTSLY